MSTRELVPAASAATKARAVTRAPDLLLQRKCACASSGPESKCEECEKKKFQCRTTGNGPSSAAALQSSKHPEPRSGHDFSKLRVQSTAEQESLSSSSRAQRPAPASASGSLEEKVARLKDHYFLCPPTADTLTNVSKAGGGGGTLGFTKIDQSSNLICAPKFDIDAAAGTCSFKPIATSLSLTSKFSSPTPESITSDAMKLPNCGDKQVPIFGKITQDISDLAKQGEQEHCDDLNISFNQTLKPCTAAVNKFAGYVFKGKNMDECFKALIASLGFDPISCSDEFADLTKKDDERDNQGMHDFDLVPLSKDCTKIVIGYKKSATNKIGDPGVAPAKFIPAASKCGKAAPAPAPTSTAPPGGSATPAPPPKKDQGGK